ncbi:hypothetical protein HC891_18565 [Candidatus Gracilibacteria bacterium]|nr:hypothetical protein [Candidatus Gracilibacteria bacterium]
MVAMVGLGVFLGAGGGAIDAGLNTYAATQFSPRTMNWLHACSVSARRSGQRGGPSCSATAGRGVSPMARRRYAVRVDAVFLLHAAALV